MTSIPIVALTVLLSMVGCSLFVPQESRYLAVAQGQATGGEVQRHLGTPIERTSTPIGGMVWRYEMLEEQPSHRGTPAGFWCDDYRLIFDAGGVLRPWTHRSFFHGGALRPEPCQAGYERQAL